MPTHARYLGIPTPSDVNVAYFKLNSAVCCIERKLYDAASKVLIA